MKFMHLGDLHLGKSLGDFDLYEDQKYILDELLRICRDKWVDSVLIAGDVYDKSVPSEAATNLLDYFISSLAREGITVFLISGNHDSDDRLNFGSSLFEANNVFISSVFRGQLAMHTLQDEYGEINVCMLPFVKASQVRHSFPDAGIVTYDDAVKTVIASAGIDSSKRNIILAHQFVSGKGEDPALGGSEGAAAQSVGLVEKIGYDIFDSFEYAALGHIHGPQSVGRDEVRYSGSPLKYSLSEVNNEKSVPIVTLKEKGNTQTELVPLVPMRDMRHIKGKLRDILDKNNVNNTEDFIYVTLTDEDMVNDVMGIVQQIYPNTVKIDYDNSHTRELEHIDISRIAENKSFAELIGDFYHMMYGCEISAEEMELMRTVAREAGVINEAD